MQRSHAIEVKKGIKDFIAIRSVNIDKFNILIRCRYAA